MNWWSRTGPLRSFSAAAGITVALTGLSLAGPVDDFLSAVDRDDQAEVLKLLKDGADPNAANRYKVTPLPVACRNGNLNL
ncbi:MAG: hypothetical protein AAF514_18250, partial [Verrucomicrobiota bacterium]